MTRKLHMKDLAGYSPHGAEKQVAHQGKDFNVVVVSLDREQEIPVHEESYDTFFFLVSGKGVFTIGGDQVVM